MGRTVVFFDLFFTLIEPVYGDSINENDVLNISIKEWEAIAEDRELYFRRATGKIRDPHEIIDEIIAKGGFNASLAKKSQLLELRMNRMRSALCNVDRIILNTLSRLKEMELKLCIISNADTIDKTSWNESPLYPLFDSVIFSCDVGYIKPHPAIYQAAMGKMGVIPQNSYFVGDGGSDELFGAKATGMRTVLSEHLVKRDNQELTKLLSYSDYHVRDFSELLLIPFNE